MFCSLDLSTRAMLREMCLVLGGQVEGRCLALGAKLREGAWYWGGQVEGRCLVLGGQVELVLTGMLTPPIASNPRPLSLARRKLGKYGDQMEERERAWDSTIKSWAIYRIARNFRGLKFSQIGHNPRKY